MKTRIVTALFDIEREKLGDGRKFNEYLQWLKQTLRLKADMTIFCEDKISDFVRSNRDNHYDTQIVVQNLHELPFYQYNQRIKEILQSELYRNRMRDTSRIECYLSEYNVIQYSKFDWVKLTLDSNPDYDYFIWMDAGCSRFFGKFDLNTAWPNTSKIDKKRLIIQGNSNFIKTFQNLNMKEYMWDNNCVLVGTLFGAGKDLINLIRNEIEEIFKYFLKQNCVNNEQFALAFLAKKYPDIMDIKVILNGKHLPLFDLLC